MGLFSRHKETKPPVGIVIIGSANITGAIVTFDWSDKCSKFLPRIAYSTNANLIKQGEAGFREYFLSVSKTLREVLSNLYLGRDLRPERFHCFLGSPFYLGQARVGRISQDKPVRVTEKMISELIAREADRYSQEQPLLYPEVLGDSNLIFENDLMQIKLNGYETDNPYNKLASEITWTQYVSIGSKVIINKLREVFHTEHNAPVDFHSFTIANYFACREVLEAGHNFIVLDVVGQLTDLIVVSGGILIEHTSYPLGLDRLEARLAQELSNSKEEAASILRMHLDDSLQTTPAITTAINTLKNEWLFSLRQGLSHVLETALLPETLLLIGQGEEMNLFATWLSDESLKDFTLSNGKLTIKVMGNDFFTHHCLFGSDTPLDPALLAASVFCAKIK